MPPLGFSAADDERLMRLVRYKKARKKGIDWMHVAKKLRQPLHAVRQQYFSIVANKATLAKAAEKKAEQTSETMVEEADEKDLSSTEADGTPPIAVVSPPFSVMWPLPPPLTLEGDFNAHLIPTSKLSNGLCTSRKHKAGFSRRAQRGSASQHDNRYRSYWRHPLPGQPSWSTQRARAYAEWCLACPSNDGADNHSGAIETHTAQISLRHHEASERQVREQRAQHAEMRAAEQKQIEAQRKRHKKRCDKGPVVTVYHQTIELFGRQILASGFRCSRWGLGGAGVYFAYTPDQTCGKARNYGYMIEATVRTGRVMDVGPWGHPGMNAKRIFEMGFDSLRIERDRPELVVYDTEQIIATRGFVCTPRGNFEDPDSGWLRCKNCMRALPCRHEVPENLWLTFVCSKCRRGVWLVNIETCTYF